MDMNEAENYEFLNCLTSPSQPSFCSPIEGSQPLPDQGKNIFTLTSGRDFQPRGICTHLFLVPVDAEVRDRNCFSAGASTPDGAEDHFATGTHLHNWDLPVCFADSVLPHSQVSVK